MISEEKACYFSRNFMKNKETAKSCGNFVFKDCQRMRKLVKTLLFLFGHVTHMFWL